MKSGKQRRIEIRDRRRKKAEPYNATNRYDLTCKPASAVASDIAELQHNIRAAYTSMPLFYLDMPFICKDCESFELWTAKQQKWWYEIAKGSIDSIAIRCRSCRKKEQARKAEARRVHLEGIANKQRL
ncbi:zinc-ribbon domain containing protein [Motilimonas cestriensis]|uniref:zinc-ribbon domain containing protein n=1 Tax=Motilimonas cestriensis TaxID=2742685 RepID=UPI003DA3C2BE